MYSLNHIEAVTNHRRSELFDAAQARNARSAARPSPKLVVRRQRRFGELLARLSLAKPAAI